MATKAGTDGTKGAQHGWIFKGARPPSAGPVDSPRSVTPQRSGWIRALNPKMRQGRRGSGHSVLLYGVPIHVSYTATPAIKAHALCMLFKRTNTHAYLLSA